LLKLELTAPAIANQAGRMSRWLSALPLAAMLLIPRLAEACAVCFSGRTDETRQAFIGSTAFMTFLPMLIIGGLAWWFRRRVLAMQAEQRASAARLVRVD
jgi:hypothetical protein